MLLKYFLPLCLLLGACATPSPSPLPSPSTLPTVIPNPTPQPEETLPSQTPRPVSTASPPTQPYPLFTPLPTLPTRTSPPPSPGLNYPIAKASPQEVCYGEQITLNVQWDKDASVTVYLERNVESLHKLPPLYQEHVLVNRLEVLSNQVVDISFPVLKTMIDLENSDKVMDMPPGRYWIRLVGPTETAGAEAITIKNCP